MNTEPQLHSPSGWVCAAPLRAAHARRAVIGVGAAARTSARAARNHSSLAGRRPRAGSPPGYSLGRARASRAARGRWSPRSTHVSPGLAAEGAGIHRQRAAQRAGNAGQRIRPAPGPSCTHCRAMRAHGTPASQYTRRLRDALEPHEGALGRDHHAADAAVAHQQIAAEADPVHRQSRRQRAQERARSSRSRGVKNTSAGPPARQEVCRLIGSSRRTRGMNSGVPCHDASWRGSHRRERRARGSACDDGVRCCRHPW